MPSIAEAVSKVAQASLLRPSHVDNPEHSALKAARETRGICVWVDAVFYRRVCMELCVTLRLYVHSSLVVLRDKMAVMCRYVRYVRVSDAQHCDVSWGLSSF